jgi:hypothetical protein
MDSGKPELIKIKRSTKAANLDEICRFFVDANCCQSIRQIQFKRIQVTIPDRPILAIAAIATRLLFDKD